MPRFAANLSMMFTEVPFLERFALAAKDSKESSLTQVYRKLGIRSRVELATKRSGTAGEPARGGATS